MVIKVAINGFGRIGRLLFRAAVERNAKIDEEIAKKIKEKIAEKTKEE